MITQSFYLDLQVMATAFLAERRDVFVDEEVRSFLRPCVFIIHRPSKQGFYLDQHHKHIIDVKDCQEPKDPVEVKREHLCKSPNPPGWVRMLFQSDEFDTFRLF